MEHFIKPATEEKQCSYVELVASGPQLAQWCLVILCGLKFWVVSKENSRNAKEKCLGYILLAKEGPDQNSPPQKSDLFGLKKSQGLVKHRNMG